MRWVEASEITVRVREFPPAYKIYTDKDMKFLYRSSWSIVEDIKKYPHLLA